MRAGEVRAVVHHAADADGAGARDCRRTPRSRLAARLTASAVGVNTSLIEATWAGWIAILPVKPSRRASSHSRAQAGIVAEIDIDRVDRLRPGRPRRRRGKGSAPADRAPGNGRRVAVGLGAELDRQVLGAPGQALQPLACAGIGAGEEHRLRGFGRDRDDVERAVGQAVDRLARGDLGVAVDDGCRRLRPSET